MSDRRVSSNDRRVSSNYDTDNQLNDISDMLRMITANHVPTHVVPATAPSETPTFTITQVLGGLVAVGTILGSMIATWVTLNNQITTLKVSTDLIFEQVHKEIANFEADNKEFHIKSEAAIDNAKDSIKDVSDRVESLDNSISQLYTRQQPKGNEHP